MLSARQTRSLHTSRVRAFTIIELLVVIAIILVLVGITFAIGRSVVGDAKKKTTEDTLRILDSALQAYIQATGENPPLTRTLLDPNNLPNGTTFFMIDGVDSGSEDPINSVGVFIDLALRVPESKAILDKLGPKQLIQLDIDGAGPQSVLPTAIDGWGKPIRFVHPKADGLILYDLGATGVDGREVEPWLGTVNAQTPYVFAKVRRNNESIAGPGNLNSADSDGGKAVGGRPYFYSAGEDGFVGYGKRAGDPTWTDFNADNVYTTQPTFGKPPA